MNGIGYFILATLTTIGGLGLIFAGLLVLSDSRGESDLDGGVILFLALAIILIILAYYLIKKGLTEIRRKGEGHWVLVSDPISYSPNDQRSIRKERDGKGSTGPDIQIGRDLSPGEQYIAYQNYHRRMGR